MTDLSAGAICAWERGNFGRSILQRILLRQGQRKRGRGCFGGLGRYLRRVGLAVAAVLLGLSGGAGVGQRLRDEPG